MWDGLIYMLYMLSCWFIYQNFETMFEDGHLCSSKLSEEELRLKIGDLDVSTPTLG